MKKIVLILFVISNLAVFAQKVSPRIFVKDNIYDFKEVPQNTKLKHEFVIKNEGTGTLEIKEVKPSCECTVIEPVVKKLEPGDSTILIVNFDTKGKIGYQREHAYILSNDPEAPVYRVSVIANVQLTKEAEEQLPTIKVQNTSFDLGEVKKGTHVSKKIELKNLGKQPLIIKKVKSGCDFLKLRLSDKKIEFEKPEYLNVEFDTKNLSGRQSCTIIVKSNDPRTRVLILTLFTDVID